MDTLSQKLDTLKSTVQQNDDDTQERLEKCELKSSRKIEALTARVDNFATLIDTLVTSSVNSKVLGVANSEQITEMSNKLVHLEAFETEAHKSTAFWVALIGTIRFLQMPPRCPEGLHCQLKQGPWPK